MRTVMSYRQTLALGWAILWRMFWWSLLITWPLWVAQLAVPRWVSTGSARVLSLDLILILMIVLDVLIALPASIQEAAADTYSDFQLSVGGRHIVQRD